MSLVIDDSEDELAEFDPVVETDEETEMNEESDNEEDLEFEEATDDEEPELEEELEEEPEFEMIFEEELMMPETNPTTEQEYNQVKYSKGVKDYKEALMRQYADGAIGDKQYFKELLELEVYENSLIKSVPITDEGLELLKQLENDRLSQKDKYMKDEISKEEYDDFYIASLKKEKTIVKNNRASVYNSKDKKSKLDISSSNKSIHETLDYIIKKEDQLVKKLAKQHNIDLVKPNSRDAASRSAEVRRKYLSDSIEYEKSKNYILERYVPGYKLKKINPTSISVPDFEIEAPVNIDEIKKLEKPPKLISELDVLEQEKRKYLASQLLKIPRESLIECLKTNNLVTNNSGYIEYLRLNKVPILKFVKYPKDQAELDEMIDSEFAGKYAVTRDLIKSSYETSTTTPDSLESVDVMNLPASKLSLKVPFKGVSRDYAGKTIQLLLDSSKKADGFEDLAKAFTPIVPVPDALYEKLAAQNKLQDSVAYVYQLYTPFPGYESQGVYVTTRYTVFEDYLRDLKGLLSATLLKLENEGVSGYTLAILQSKIDKISDYLSGTKRETDVKDIVKIQETFSKISDVRRSGSSKLNRFIMEINSEALPKSESLEELINERATSTIEDRGQVISEFNEPTYKYLIDKSIIVLTQYPDILEDFIIGNTLPSYVVDFETPLIKPEDFTKEEEFKSLSDTDKYAKLLEWSPPKEYYVTYRKYYIDSGGSADKLRSLLLTDSIELSEYQISKIIEEANENKLWTEAIDEVGKITEHPAHFTLDLWKFRQLNKKKYRLPSQTIYRVATIDQRLELYNELMQIFANCNIKDFNRVAYVTENIIFNRSKTDKDYKKYKVLILENFKQLCKYIVNATDITEYIVIITEFFFKNGDKLIFNQDKVDKILEAIQSEDPTDTLNKLSAEELDIYKATLIKTEHLEDTRRRFNLLRNVSKVIGKLRKSQVKLYNKKINTYVKPHVQTTKPDNNKYIYYEDKYIVGGNYPQFEDEFGNKNYSRDDLIELSILFGVKPDDDENVEQAMYNTYISVMNKIQDLENPTSVADIVEKPKRELDFKVYAEPRVTVQYTFRPRMGVPNPGEVYYTSKGYISQYKKQYPTNRDYYERQYGVPYTFENFLPVYHSRLKELVDSKLIMIEGPAIFRSEKEDPAAVYITSPYYIFVEYKDSFGKIIYFREGVSEKKVKTTAIENLDTCSRFKDEISCNNLNSYSLDSRKCVWTGKKCISSIVENKVIESKDVWEYEPDDEELKLPWSSAILASKKYIEEVSMKQNLGAADLDALIVDQTNRLYKYRLELEKSIKQKKPTTLENDTRLIEIVEEATIKPGDTKKLGDTDMYKLISIQQTQSGLNKRSLTSRELMKFKKFKLEEYGEVDIVNVFYDKNLQDHLVNVIHEGNQIQLSIKLFKVSDTIPTVRVKPVFVYITEEDYKYLQNPPQAFTWTLSELDYNVESFVEDELPYKTSTVNYIDTTMIQPSGTVNDTPLITKEDINKAMYKLAFSEYTKQDDAIVLKTAINATQSAIKVALQENISLLSEDFKFIVREINVDDVIAVLEKDKPQVTTLEKSLNSQLDKAIKDSDKKEIKDLLKKFEKAKIENDLTVEAAKKLVEIEDKELSKKSKETTTTVARPEIRPKREITKNFKKRSVVTARDI
jgi:hypothetical protein